MEHYVYEDELDRIELGDGEWIDIKRQMSVGDLDRIDGESKDGIRVMPVLRLNIKAWSLKDKEGNPIPVNKETMARLSADTAQVVIIEIGKRNLKEKKA